MQIHEGDNLVELEDFWAEMTGIVKCQFNKTIIRPVGNKAGKSRGTCKIRVHDKILFLRLLALLEKLRGVVHRQNVRFGSGRQEVQFLSPRPK